MNVEDNNFTDDMNSTMISTQFDKLIDFNATWDPSFSSMPVDQVIAQLKYNPVLYETYAFYVLIFMPPDDLFNVNNSTSSNSSFPALNLSLPID
jgi:hypothetical protein